MIITIWILFIIFSYIGLMMLRKFVMASLNTGEAVIFFTSILIAAISAGVLFGGLKLPFI